MLQGQFLFPLTSNFYGSLNLRIDMNVNILWSGRINVSDGAEEELVNPSVPSSSMCSAVLKVCLYHEIKLKIKYGGFDYR